jgi:hypothetical protein
MRVRRVALPLREVLNEEKVSDWWVELAVHARDGDIVGRREGREGRKVGESDWIACA